MTLREVNRVGEGQKNVPKLRFKGYEDAWEQRKAKRLFVSRVDKGYPDLPVLSATQDKGMVRRDENGINIHYDEKNKSGYKRVMPGQFVIHLRSFQGGFAYSEIEGITSPAYTVFDFQELDKHIPEFWKYVFSSKDFIRRLEKVTYGIRDGRSIGFEDFLTLKFNIPEKREQKVIAEILARVNNLITLHQRKYDALKTMKKTLLSKMFPKDGEDDPEIRFKGFTDAWEQRKLGEISQRVQGNDGRMSLPTLTISAAYGWMDQVDRFSGNIAGTEQKNYTLLKKGELSYNHGNSKLAKYGAVFELSTYEEALVPKVYHSFKMIKGNSKFIEFLFATKLPDRELSKLISSGARMDGLLNITYSDFASINLTVPSETEQKMVSNCLKELDDLITLHQRKLEELKNMKKTLLQQMFV